MKGETIMDDNHKSVSLLDEIKILSEWHIDYDADENNNSPDDQVAHINGLIYQKTKKVIELINKHNGKDY